MPLRKVKKRRNLVKKLYPGIYVALLRHFDMTDEAKDFMDSCKLFKYGKCDQYSLYIHGYLLPWHQQQRELGKLTVGK